MRSRRGQLGQIVVLATISLVAFLGMVALAIDVGFLWATRRTMQTASDAAAIAGAEALSNGGSVSTAATTVAEQTDLHGQRIDHNGEQSARGSGPTPET